MKKAKKEIAKDRKEIDNEIFKSIYKKIGGNRNARINGSQRRIWG